MTHTFAATPARSRTRASRAPHSKNPLTNTYSEKVQITAAMALLHAGVDTSVIALWLGHEDPSSTQAYLHADMTIKEQALSRVAPPNTSPGRYRAPTPSWHSSTTSDPAGKPGLCRPPSRPHPAEQHVHTTVGIIRGST
jgi:hypothetical protein